MLTNKLWKKTGKSPFLISSNRKHLVAAIALWICFTTGYNVSSGEELLKVVPEDSATLKNEERNHTIQAKRPRARQRLKSRGREESPRLPQKDRDNGKSNSRAPWALPEIPNTSTISLPHFPLTAENPGQWGISAGLGGGLQNFFGSLRLDYNYSKFLAPQASLSYAKTHEQSASTLIETRTLIYGANPTPFWPFAGAGIGFADWKQKDSLGIFDEGSSLVWTFSYGLRLKLTENFSLLLESKTLGYLGEPPADRVINRGFHDERLIRKNSVAKVFAYSFSFSVAI